jgi:hypothetical protein
VDMQVPMPKRLRMIFRVLSAVTLLEGLGGIYSVAADISIVPITLKLMQRPYIHSTWLLFPMAAMNLLFVVILFVAGAFIWKLQRRGLFLLACTLLAELVYFIGTIVISIFLERPSSTNFVFLVAAGNTPIGLQIFTAFPIVAGILIFFAYRYLGIPARPLK